MVSPVHFSSKSSEWATPQAFYERLNDEFHFTLDVCASQENAKCDHFFDAQADGLRQSWSGETCWCNPPYGRAISQWTSKAVESTLAADAPPHTTVVMLLPARTDTRWWHDDVMTWASEVRFVAGRLHFGGAPHAAPFPSAVAVFNSRSRTYPRVSAYPCR